MTSVEVFDPPMCCPSGVCGPQPDAALARFAAGPRWLDGQGVPVTRYEPTRQPEAFAAHPAVLAARKNSGDGTLPVIAVNGALVCQARYPTRRELAQWAGLPTPTCDLAYTPMVAELVAIGAAIASNCEPCLDFHVAAARDLGLDDTVIRQTVDTAHTVKNTPARSIRRRAEALLGPGEPTPNPPRQANHCCPTPPPSASSGGCC